MDWFHLALHLKLCKYYGFCILAYALGWGVVAVITLYMAALGAVGEWKVVAATDFPLSMRA